MTNDKDRDKVTKGAVKEMLESLYVSDMKMHPDEEPAYWVEVSKIEAAIDALEPVAEVRDAVSEEIIRKIKTFLTYPRWPDDKFRIEIRKLFSAPDPADKEGGTDEK